MKKILIFHIIKTVYTSPHFYAVAALFICSCTYTLLLIYLS